jgi:protein-S-isoprenylcysteine O-methyltransferase Ste14
VKVTGSEPRTRELTVWNHVRAILLLPFMNTVIVPSILLLTWRDAGLLEASFVTNAIFTSLGSALLVTGIVLVVRSMRLFILCGRGTLAPWDPTENLITADIYRSIRNPMKAGLFLVLIGESLVIRSPSLTLWTLAFITANVIYIRWFEEPGLTARFGHAYSTYCSEVPRWLPKTLFRWRQLGSAGPLS